MLLKILDRNIDHIIQKPYVLCRVNMEEFQQFMLQRLSSHDLKRFNLYYDHCRFNSDLDGETFKESDEDNKLIFSTAAENSFLSVWAMMDEPKEDTFELPQEIYLLDGFRRLFFELLGQKRDLNRDAYLKVYTKETTDRDVMALMFHFNLWKIPQGMNIWFDRGWRFFLYLRLNIMLNAQNYQKNTFESHFDLLTYYLQYISDYNISGWRDIGAYPMLHTLVTSEEFYDDLRLIDELTRYNFKSDSETYRRTIARIAGKARLGGCKGRVLVEDIDRFLKLNVDEVNKIKKLCVGEYTRRHIEGLVQGFFAIWKDEKLLAELRGADVSKIIPKEIFPSEWLETIPEEIRKRYDMKTESDLYVTIKRNYFRFDRGKLSCPISGLDGCDARVFLFIDDVFVYRMKALRDEWYINEVGVKPTFIWGVGSELEKGILFRGTKENMLKKLEEITGRKIELNIHKTEFILTK